MTPCQIGETGKQCPTKVCFETSDVHPLTSFISLYTIMPVIISTLMAAGNKEIELEVKESMN